MKVLKVDHIGIAVSDLSAAKKLYEEILGLKVEGEEVVEEQKVKTVFIPVGDSEIELLESTSPDGAIAKFIEKRGQGIQHIALRVDNIEKALEECKAAGIKLIDEKPRRGAGGARPAGGPAVRRGQGQGPDRRLPQPVRRRRVGFRRVVGGRGGSALPDPSRQVDDHQSQGDQAWPLAPRPAGRHAGREVDGGEDDAEADTQPAVEDQEVGVARHLPRQVLRGRCLRIVGLPMVRQSGQA